MTQAAELATDNFIRAGLDRLEPHRNHLSRNRILRDPHADQREIVDHIFRRKFHDHRPIHWDMQFAEHDDIVAFLLTL